MILFLIGLFVGVFIGFIFAGILAMSRDRDEDQRPKKCEEDIESRADFCERRELLHRKKEPRDLV